jgi:predicted hydrocarbon binding protein
MNGTFFVLMRRLVVSDSGPEAWLHLLREAKLDHCVFTADKSYPDSYAAHLVDTAAEAAGVTRAELLEAFGRFSAPELLREHPELIQPGWNVLECIERTANAAQHVIAGTDLVAAHLPDGELVITLTLPLDLCPLAKGVLQGLGDHYGEFVHVTETGCAKDGHPGCTFAVRSKVMSGATIAPEGWMEMIGAPVMSLN